jgi:tRNA 5-methylaminomethyl-2-thiouridine biosynthesis bifunctional protein
MQLQSAQLTWRNGLPYSSQFDDIYFSPDNGLAETQYVFLEANQLQGRFSQLPRHGSFTLAETGFGTGLNFLATWQLWQHTPRQAHTWLHIVSTEKYPLTLTDFVTRFLFTCESLDGNK